MGASYMEVLFIVDCGINAPAPKTKQSPINDRIIPTNTTSRVRVIIKLY